MTAAYEHRQRKVGFVKGRPWSGNVRQRSQPIVPTPISDDKREQTIEAVHAGVSRNDIAKQVGVSRGTVTNAATTIRQTLGHANLARAHEVRSAYSAERRVEIAKRLVEDADRLLDGLNGE
jgi:DNA-binding NarL/FixJ family response regulator